MRFLNVSSYSTLKKRYPKQENCNSPETYRQGLIIRTIAQIDVHFSNSMIEMLFLRLKLRYLFKIPLTNFELLTKSADYFFTQSNEYIPHAVLKGATPLEVMTGKWTAMDIETLKKLAQEGLAERIQINKSSKCVPCLA